VIRVPTVRKEGAIKAHNEAILKAIRGNWYYIDDEGEFLVARLCDQMYLSCATLKEAILLAAYLNNRDVIPAFDK
jgi:hypothetical protein